MADEAAARLSSEFLRSAFAISAEHVLTAWHCVRDAARHRERLWFRLPDADSLAGPGYVYLPVAVLEQDEASDVAVLVVDKSRLSEETLLPNEATQVLARSVIRLGVDVSVHDQVRVIGFPANAPSASHSSPFLATVAGLAVPLGAATGLQLEGPSFAAVDPVDPRGLSGGPVLKLVDSGAECAVGVVRWVPRGHYKCTALGGALIATRIEDIAASLPQVAAALLSDASGPVKAARRRPEESVAELLRADADLVNFLGRDEERRELRAWCDAPAGRGAWLITGPAGQGKTRLAMQLCAELTGTGTWATRILRGPGDTAGVRDLCRRTAAAGRSLLLVVDYAAEFGAAAFAELASVLTDDPAYLPRLRLLLLARSSGDWWQPRSSGSASATALRPRLIAGGVEVPQRELGLDPLIPDPDARRPVFDQIVAQLRPAVDAFAIEHGMTVADPYQVPDLSVPDLASALMLHLAAVGSLLPPAGRPPNPAEAESASDLINGILDLECQRHWLYADAGSAHLYRPTEEAFGDLARTEGGVAVETAVAAATLAGAPTAYAAMQLLTRMLDVNMSQARARAIAGWLHNLYPLAECDRDKEWLPPLRPDLLGEELVVRVIRRQQDDGVPLRQLLPYRILGCASGSITADQILRMLVVTIRAGTRHSDIAKLIADISGRGGLVADIPDEVDLSSIAYALPHDCPINLLGAAAAIIAHVIRHYDLTQPGCDSTHPELLDDLVHRLLAARQTDEALAAAKRAVSAYERLTSISNDAQPELAWSLGTLSQCLIMAGQPNEALGSAERSVAILDRLVQVDQRTHLAALAVSLTILSGAQAGLGLPAALATAERALAIQERLVSRDPAAHQAQLARSLQVVSLRLAERGRHEEALTSAERAVDLYKGLVIDRPPIVREPDAYAPYLAQALDNLADRQAEAGRRPKGLRAGNQAVATWEWLAQVSPDANPDAYLGDLADSLGKQANRLVQAGFLLEGIDACERAIGLRTSLSPDDFLLNLAGSLHNLSLELTNTGQNREALRAAEQAAVIARKLAETRLDRYLTNQAISLMTISGILASMGRMREAIAVGEEAVAVSEQLPCETPVLAASLNNLSIRLRSSRRRAGAVVISKRAVAVSERLVVASPNDPDAYLLLVSSLVTLSGVARRAEAGQAWEDATTRVGQEADIDLRLLWACWNWIRTSTFKAERDFLSDHPELLVNGSERQLAHFLRATVPGQAERYLTLIGWARVRGISNAYRDLCR